MSPPGWLVVSIRFYIVSTVHVSTIKPPYIILSVSPILRQNPETNLCMCIGRKASLDDLSLWFERFRMLIRFYPYVGTIRNKCKRQDPPLITLSVSSPWFFCSFMKFGLITVLAPHPWCPGHVYAWLWWLLAPQFPDWWAGLIWRFLCWSYGDSLPRTVVLSCFAPAVKTK